MSPMAVLLKLISVFVGALLLSVVVQAQAPQPAEPETNERSHPQSPAEANGFFAAHQRLGRQVPLGRDIIAGHVEPSGRQYLPDATHPHLRGVRIIEDSGHASVSPHATGTATMIYGQRGLAPGVKNVHAFSTDDWLTRGYLNAGMGLAPNNDHPARVFNHSWISNDVAGAEEVLRRVDYQIDTTGVVMCVGVNNKARSRLPVLLGQAYNVITVGSVDANDEPTSSRGQTFLEGANRVKPDLVASPGLTSQTTAMASAAVLRLLEAAERLETDEQRAAAARPETIKAVLMTGARKTEKWKAAKDKPLDEHRGSGQLDFDRSLAIFEPGPTGNADMIPFEGWDMAQLEAGQVATYNFHLLEPAEQIVMTLVWHRRVDPAELRNLRTGEKLWIPLPYMTRFRLQLRNMTRPATPNTLAESDSAVDNVQHLSLAKLEPGIYQIRVFRYPDPSHREPWRFALAWRMNVLEP